MARSASLAGNLPEYSVGQIARAVRRTVEGAFERVRVRGEISGLTRAASGHLYLSLKDETAVLDSVVWRNAARRLPVRPEDGLEVVCEGRLTTYAPRSRYQLVIETMAVAGEGALLALLEERRRKLAAEGLFDRSRKRAIPFLPEVVGVVTSPSGAALRDILQRLGDRFPRRVLLWPARVQGDGAAAEIARAIAGFDRLAPGGAVPRPDVLIVARGGGSIEDLWAFNEEAVARAAAACRIPLISAVGHETDTTLIDHAADWRAPTPTAAAEKAVPVRAELVVDLLDRARRLAAGFARVAADRRAAAAGLARGLPRPRAALDDAAQRLDAAARGLARAAAVGAERRRARLGAVYHRLRRPAERIADSRGRYRLAAQALETAARARAAALRRALERWSGDGRLAAAARRAVADRRAAAAGPARGLPHPRAALDAAARRLDAAARGLARAASVDLERRRAALVGASRRLRRPTERIADSRGRRGRAARALAAAARRALAERRRGFDALAPRLESVSYRNVLARGYAVARGPDGTVARTAAAARRAGRLSLEFRDGRVEAAVRRPGRRPAPPRARAGAQESLL